MTVKAFLITIAFTAAVGITFLGLYFNIQTVVLNEEVKTLKKEVWRLQKENAHLEVKYLNRVRADHLEKVASEKLNMIPERNGKIYLYKVQENE